jgi:peptidoglycan/xylan/chitin deacetylase (PgdA/CDA1 family)
MDAILTFHALDAGRSPVSLPPAGFERIVKGLLDDGVRVVPLRELLAPAAGAHRVALTFDDGYRSAFSEALPLLARLELPATMYVVSEWVGRDNCWPSQGAGIPASPLMDWEELADWRAQGLDIGAHTANHVPLRRLTEEQWADELAGCRARLEAQLGAPVEDFAYPCGVVGRGAHERVGRVFRTAVTARLGFVRPGADPLRLPRIDAYYLRGAAAARPLFGAATRARLSLRGVGRGLRAVGRSLG